MDEQAEKIISLAEAVQVAGGRALLVGGCVRDELMGVEPKDLDVEVYGVEAQRLLDILAAIGTVNTVGEAFTVYKLDNEIDVSLPRRERKSGRGHRAFVVEGDPAMSVAEASRRRDFTINAILKDPLTDEIIDPFNGRADISNKSIRAVAADTFVEDSLRVLRAAQFAGRFDFDIDPATAELCRSIDLDDLPKERIWAEIEKLLLRSRRPSLGIKQLYELNIAEKLFPELTALIGVPQEPEWHPEGDVDIHTMMVVDEAAKLIDDLPHEKKVTVMLGALCHDLGKPATTEMIDGRWRSLAHDMAGVEPTESLLDTLGVNTLHGYDVRHQVIQLVKYHLKPGEFYKANPPVGDGAFRRLAGKVELDLLYRVSKADSLGRNPEWLPREKWFDAEAQEWFLEKARSLNVEVKAPESILQGRHLIELGLKPGPIFGEIIDAVYQLQLDGKISDLDEAIAKAKEMI